MNSTLLLTAVLSLFAGAAAAFVLLRGRVSRLESELGEARRSESAERERAATVQARLDASEEMVKGLRESEERIRLYVKDAANDAFKSTQESLLQVAGKTFDAQSDKAAKQVASLVQPVKDTLGRFEQKIGEVEKQRVEGFAGLGAQIERLTQANSQLHDAAHGLRRALSTPSVRGQWGELTLRRLVEMAGMTEHCDFLEQETVQGGSGQLRPDLVVLLPGGRRIAVDSKVPLEQFLRAMDAEDEGAQRSLLKAHAMSVRGHVKTLSQRSYQDSIGDSPDFVVLYLSDAAYSAAVQARPEIVEEAIQEKVVLATPMLLVGLLKTIEHAWRQESLAENAEEIRRLGRELYERVAKLGEHFEKVGRGLGSAVAAYNDAVGSLESRLLATGRKFDALGITSTKSLPDLDPIDEQPRNLTAPEFSGDEPADD